MGSNLIVDHARQSSAALVARNSCQSSKLWKPRSAMISMSGVIRFCSSLGTKIRARFQAVLR